MTLFRRRNRNRDPEPERETRAYTDEIVHALLQAARGETVSSPGVTAGLEAASGMYSRAFAVAEVEGTGGLVSRDILKEWGRRLIRYGEALAYLDVDADGNLELLDVSACDISGRPSRSSWRYRVDLPAPSGTLTKTVSSDAVFHVRYSYDPNTPWRGVGPLGWATATGSLASNLETYLSDELGRAHGWVLPLPGNLSEQSRKGLEADLRNLRGQTALVETTSDAYGAGAPGAPASDYKAQRIGAHPPQEVTLMHSAVFASVLSACGISADLFSDRGAQGQRESWRRFLHGSAQPLADLIAEELTRVLERPISVNLDRLFASDIQGRARALQSMVGAGMDVSVARALAGLDA